MTPQEQLEWLWTNCDIVYWPRGNKPAFTLNPIPRVYDGNIIEAEARRAGGTRLANRTPANGPVS